MGPSAFSEQGRGRGQRRAALRSPNYLKLVIDGERNLTEAMAARFAKACALGDEEGEYFVDLVSFNQARTATERAEGYAKLTGFRRYRRAHKLELAQDAYHSQWYLPAIRELAARSDWLNLHGETLEDLAAVEVATGRTSAAFSALEEAIALYERKGNVVAASRARQRFEQTGRGGPLRLRQ